MKISGYSNSKVFRHGPFWSSWERTFWSSWEIVAVRYPRHGWSAVEDCPRPEAGSAPNVRQHNSGACIYWSQICMKRAKIQCMFKAPFLWATINSPSEVDLWRRRERCMLCRFFTLELKPYIFAGFNHTQNVQMCIVYRDHPSFKQSIICIWPALTIYIRAETLAIIKWSKEDRSWTEICTCRACISILCHQWG